MSNGFQGVWIIQRNLESAYNFRVHGNDREGWWDLEFRDVPAAALFAKDMVRLGILPRDHIRIRRGDRWKNADLWGSVVLSVLAA